MKLIGTDNYNRDSVADILVVENIPNVQPEILSILENICDYLNLLNCAETSETFYKLVEDNYRLSRGMEDLI